MFYELSHTELVEEIFIEDFSEAQKIVWLRDNSDNFGYDSLMTKYEPIWSQQSSKLKLAVASFGQCTNNLQKIYQQEDDPLIKGAVLRNPNFGSVINFFMGIDEDEIKKLYKKRKPFSGLFGQLFCNPKISPDFIADLFSTTAYKEVKQADLTTILRHLVKYTKNDDGKVPVECWMEHTYTGNAENRAISSLVEFIANFNFKLCKGEIFETLFAFERCFQLLPDFRFHLDTKLQADVLRKFDPENFPKKVLEDHYYDMERVILFIQGWFAKNFFKHSSPDYLYSDFKNSANVRERSLYYQNSKLSDIFSVETFRSEYLPNIEDILWYKEILNETSVAKMVPNEGLEINREGWSSKEHMIAYEAFEKHLLLDQHRFVGSLACNDSFYRTKRDRDWLQRLCSESDDFFSLVSADILIFGTGTCSEIFDAKLAQVQKLYPEEFIYLTEVGMLRAIQTELTELKKIKTTVTGLTRDVNQADTSLAKLLKNQKEIEEATGRKLQELQEQLEQTNNHLKDMLHLRGEPTDLISRVILNTPIIGKILKKLLK